MLLNDDCHSIDSPNMPCILENVKFPNSPYRDGNEFRFYGKDLSQKEDSHDPPYH